MKADIVIVGGGIAGLSAAMAAREKSQKVILLESKDQVGGIAKDCFHHFICGIFKNQASGFEIANPGVASKIADYLYSLYGESCHVKMGKVNLLAFEQEKLWQFFEKQLAHSNVRIFTQTQLLNVIKNDQKITAIETQGALGEIFIKTKAVVDATGGSGFGLKNSKQLYDSTSQLSGFCMQLKGTLSENISIQIPYQAQKLVKQLSMASHLKWVTISKSPVVNDYVLKFNVRSEDDILPCKKLYKRLCEKIPELGRLKLENMSGKIHPRASSKRYCLMLSAIDQKIPSGVVSFWPQERWDEQKGAQYIYCSEDEPWKIPESAFVEPGCENLFLAGKSIRVTEALHASARVMGVCMATGEKAMVNALDYVKSF